MARSPCPCPRPRPSPPGIEELCQKREELSQQIQQEEEEKQRLQNEVRQLTEKLARVNENLARKIASRNEFDRTIAETEAAYLKVRLGAALAAWVQASPRGFWPGALTVGSDRDCGAPGPTVVRVRAAPGAWRDWGSVPCVRLVPDSGQQSGSRGQS